MIILYFHKKECYYVSIYHCYTLIVQAIFLMTTHKQPRLIIRLTEIYPVPRNTSAKSKSLHAEMRWKYSKVSRIFLTFETKTILLFYSGYFPFAWRVFQKIPILFSQWCYVNLKRTAGWTEFDPAHHQNSGYLLACTQTLFYFSFASNPPHVLFFLSRALEGFWRENRAYVNRLDIYRSCVELRNFNLLHLNTSDLFTNEYWRQLFAIRRQQHSQNC